MSKLKRTTAYNLRNAIHDAERTIPFADRSQLAEWERDLAATACVALWDINIPHMLRCLRRLAGSPERKTVWSSVLGMAEGAFRPNVQGT